MSIYEKLEKTLKKKQHTWLVTGVAGFIGSHLMERLLKLNQKVIGLDNFSTGFRHNLDLVLLGLTQEQRNNFSFIEGDIRNPEDCKVALKGVEYVLHNAALGSVPRSIKDPQTTNEVNVGGFVNMISAAATEQVKKFVYASSSSVYGDSEALPKVEENTGKLLSPYAGSKVANEVYAQAFANSFPIKCIGLRYFNVFGARQNPEGPYAAVIPLWIKSLSTAEDVFINGDGKTSRDFCYIENVVQMNLLAAVSENEEAQNEAYNVALGDQTTLNELFDILKEVMSLPKATAKYRGFREGDVRHSLASIEKASDLLGYLPQVRLKEGLEKTVPFFLQNVEEKDAI